MAQSSVQRHDRPPSLSSSRSLATASTSFRHENGRTYHAYRDGEYWQPNDDQQREHEGIVHHMCILTLNDQLFLAPIGDDPRHILDIGTGTGIWASDVADKFPHASVIATDLSPVATDDAPDNCEFVIDDCASEWLWPRDHFDFVHIRGLFGSIGDWPHLYRQAYATLTPGAWLEQVEFSVRNHGADGPLDPNSPLARWSTLAIEGGVARGKSFTIAEDMATLIRDAGFVDVVEQVYKWPIGTWSSDPKGQEIGRWNLQNWEMGIEGWVLAPYTRVLGWTFSECQEWLEVVRAALRDPELRVYHQVRLVYARKPRI